MPGGWTGPHVGIRAVWVMVGRILKPLAGHDGPEGVSGMRVIMGGG